MSEDIKKESMKTAVYYPNPTETLGTVRECKVCNATQSKTFKRGRWEDFEGKFKHHPDCELAAQADKIELALAIVGEGEKNMCGGKICTSYLKDIKEALEKGYEI